MEKINKNKKYANMEAVVKDIEECGFTVVTRESEFITFYDPEKETEYIAYLGFVGNMIYVQETEEVSMLARESSENEGMKFKAICTEVLPLLNGITEVLKKNNVRPETMASMAVGGDGYLSFSLHDSDWSMIRVFERAEVKLICKSTKEIVLEEGK